VAARGTAHPMWTPFLNRVTDGNVELQAVPAALHRLLLHRQHDRARIRLCLRHWRQRQGKVSQHRCRRLRRLPYGSRHVTFLASNQERHPTELAKLAGARLVVAQETQKGRRWDETKIKALTGGDKITARFMRLIGEKLPWVAMSAIGKKRTSACALHMSAFDPKRTFASPQSFK
jgi:putative DNA primase/helicase